ncbi:hypothetical protein [Rhizobium phaseoli]|uniref:hypothetical protein n=1 Tax=Rhizobium phaseoli TaxID=396 RepID=UPI00036D8059|nr:hypothetical protein [Rhizobium phaseoli]KKZ89370.1 hypothetical protein RPHASCH2410_CH01875 [Rhizobium phaseoli Ch24-10]
MTTDDVGARESFELVWGVEEIAKLIDRTPRQTFHILKTQRLRGVKKVAGRWVAQRGTFLTNFIEPQ